MVKVTTEFELIKLILKNQSYIITILAAMNLNKIFPSKYVKELIEKQDKMFTEFNDTLKETK